MDKKFDAVKEHVSFLQVNTTAAREHVGEIERELRTVKEHVRDAQQGDFLFGTFQPWFLSTKCIMCACG